MADLSILVINGPNLNLLGKREVEIYGSTTLTQLEERLIDDGRRLGVRLSFFQSNHEGHIIDRIHTAFLDEKIDGILINPGGLTHTSVALRDALLGTKIPFVEVHISNIYGREDFRHKSFLSDVAIGVISGLGITGYRFGLAALLERLRLRIDVGLYLPEKSD
ncbi:MAG: type II 3-dehydroquinate dehydratase [Leptonema sp. (in: Bacteria)]|nr:type II 3-dehydroquinate dehydratase [Leptonema sp. (in: bacteria)]